jgi:hypothetical protein
MWKMYGSDLCGIAIGFRPTAITSMPGRIQKVRYLDENTPESFRQLVRDMASKFDPERSDTDVDYWLNAALSTFTAITALKHHTWEYEKEIRFIHAQSRENFTGIPIAQLPNGAPLFWEKPLTRQRDEETVEYKSFDFGKFSKGHFDASRSIDKIILGPKCQFTRADIETLLSDNGFVDFSIEMSECQIR